ncbi:hypothetical protein DV517_09920 [Streptomyces sp. S816]|nr:hypothetical protein DV517_09920 [Streptomyces sp. S816]
MKTRRPPPHAVLPSGAGCGTVCRPGLPRRTLRTGPAQGRGTGDVGLAAPLGAGLLGRGQRIIHDGNRLGERPTGQLPHRSGLPLHRLRDVRGHPRRRRCLPARGELAAVAVRGGLPGTRRPGGRGRGLRVGVARPSHRHRAGRQDPQGAYDRPARRLVGGRDNPDLFEAGLRRPGRRLRTHGELPGVGVVRHGGDVPGELGGDGRPPLAQRRAGGRELPRVLGDQRADRCPRPIGSRPSCRAGRSGLGLLRAAAVLACRFRGGPEGDPCQVNACSGPYPSADTDRARPRDRRCSDDGVVLAVLTPAQYSVGGADGGGRPAAVDMPNSSPPRQARGAAWSQLSLPFSGIKVSCP